jgi:hypothetical protein
MQLKKLLEKWDLNSLKIKTPFLEMNWQPNDKDKTAARDEFRAELSALQKDLRNYTRLLADMADVEDLTDLEAV